MLTTYITHIRAHRPFGYLEGNQNDLCWYEVIYNTYRECIRCSHHGWGCFNALYSFRYLTPGVLEWCWPVRARIAWADGLEMELVTDCDRETRGYSCALWPHDGTTTPEDDVSTAREEDVIGNWLKLALPITTHMIHVLTRCHFVYIQSYKHNNNANTNHIRGRSAQH